MTVSSWGDVPPGMPMHHHCVVTVERDHDPRLWTDATSMAPSLVAWQPDQAVEWMRDTISRHLADAFPDYRPWVEAALSSDNGRWERIPRALQMGRWVMDPHQLGPGRKLVFQILGYADAGNPKIETRGRYYEYAVCPSHQRPDDSPYLGLTEDIEEHFRQYGTLYAASS